MLVDSVYLSDSNIPELWPPEAPIDPTVVQASLQAAPHSVRRSNRAVRWKQDEIHSRPEVQTMKARHRTFRLLLKIIRSVGVHQKVFFYNNRQAARIAFCLPWSLLQAAKVFPAKTFRFTAGTTDSPAVF